MMSRIASEFTGRLKEISQEMGNLQNAKLLSRWGESIESKFQVETVYVDVYLSEYVWNFSAHPFWDLFEGEGRMGNNIVVGKFGFQFRHEVDLPIRKQGDAVSALAVILLDETMVTQSKLPPAYRKNSFLYAFSFLLFASEEGKEQNPFSTSSRSTFQIKAGDWRSKTMSTLINEILPDNALPALSDKSVLLSVAPSLQVLSDTLLAETQLVSVRRGIVNAQGILMKKEESQLNMSDLSSQVRSIVQQSLSDLEKEMRMKYDELNRPTTGIFSNKSLEAASRVNDLEKRAMAEKTEKIGLTIKGGEIEAILSEARAELRREFEQDLKGLDLRLASVCAEIDQKLQSKHLNAAKLEPEKCTITAERTLDSFAVYNKFYVGEMIKKGTMEYFVSLRDYVGIIMVVVGLLAPIGYAAGLFDILLGEKAGFGGQIRAVIQGFGAVVSIGLMVFGYFDLRKRIPERRKEEFERELNKARELIITECKRIYSESSRDWATSLGSWVRDYQSALLGKVEKC